MPKPVYATADELAEAVKKLEGQVRVEMLPADGRDWPRGQIHCVWKFIADKYRYPWILWLWGWNFDPNYQI